MASSEDKTFNIYHDLSINVPTHKVFEAITNPEILTDWWPLKCKGFPIIGSEYNFYFGDTYDWYGKVVKVKKNRRFYIQMTDSDADWNSTMFGFLLSETDKGTYLEFSHIGWKSTNAHFRRSSYSWAVLLFGLQEYLEQGTIIPFEKRG